MTTLTSGDGDMNASNSNMKNAGPAGHERCPQKGIRRVRREGVRAATTKYTRQRRAAIHQPWAEGPIVDSSTFRARTKSPGNWMMKVDDASNPDLRVASSCWSTTASRATPGSRKRPVGGRRRLGRHAAGLLPHRRGAAWRLGAAQVRLLPMGGRGRDGAGRGLRGRLLAAAGRPCAPPGWPGARSSTRRSGSGGPSRRPGLAAAGAGAVELRAGLRAGDRRVGAGPDPRARLPDARRRRAGRAAGPRRRARRSSCSGTRTNSCPAPTEAGQRPLAARPPRVRAGVRADADAVVTVSDTLAELLQREHHLAERPAVLLNAPAVAPAAASGPVPDLRALCGLGPGDAAAGLQRVRDGAARTGHRRRGVAAAARRTPGAGGERSGRRRTCGGARHAPPARASPTGCTPSRTCRTARWPAFLATADIGVIPIHRWPNHEIALITKFFEYSHARLPIVVSDVRTMAETVRATGQGEVFRAQDTADFVRAVRAVLADPQRYRAAYDSRKPVARLDLGGAGRRAGRALPTAAGGRDGGASADERTPDVSVVLPVHNTMPYLTECLEVAGRADHRRGPDADRRGGRRFHRRQRRRAGPVRPPLSRPVHRHPPGQLGRPGRSVQPRPGRRHRPVRVLPRRRRPPRPRGAAAAGRGGRRQRRGRGPRQGGRGQRPAHLPGHLRP